MVVCTFRPGVARDEVTAMVAEEQAVAKALREEGLVSAIGV